MLITNISGYRFTPLENLDELKGKLKAFCTSQALKGTVLLSTEGINIMLAGTATAIHAFQEYLGTFSAFTRFDFKESFSSKIPFRHLFVKLKKRLLPLNANPLQKTGRRLSPATFKLWLDQARPMIVLDTRNQYEIACGKFSTAIDFDIAHFADFSDAAGALITDEMRQLPIVTYCTGGIRCEKATQHLLDRGCTEVYQLEGGILRYFEHCGSAHYQGNCFVFDERTALTPDLKPVGDA